MEALIGYPEFAVDTNQLDQMYQKFDVMQDNYLENIVSRFFLHN